MRQTMEEWYDLGDEKMTTVEEKLSEDREWVMAILLKIEYQTPIIFDEKVLDAFIKEMDKF